MSELEQVLAGDSAHTPPARILEGLSSDAAHKPIGGAPHTIYQELWHIAFWQQMTLDWVRGFETPYPLKPTNAFPSDEAAASEPWAQLCERFFAATFPQRRLQFKGDIEMIDQCGLAAAGYETKLLDPCRTRLFYRVLDQRFVHNGQHLFGDRLGSGQETSPEAGDGEDSFA